MQKSLENIFEGNIADLGEGVVLKGVIGNIKELPKSEVGRAFSFLSPKGRLIVMKERCKVGDNVACMAYDVVINGDEGALAGTPSNLGLRGLWNTERDERSGELLKAVGEL